MNAEQLRELQELAHQLDELTKHPGWEVYVDFVLFGAGGQRHHQQRVISGACKTTEEYQHQVGWIAGSQHALDAPKNVRKMADDYSKKAGQSDDQD